MYKQDQTRCRSPDSLAATNVNLLWRILFLQTQQSGVVLPATADFFYFDSINNGRSFYSNVMYDFIIIPHKSY